MEARINARIRAQKVRVVSDDGEFLGIMAIKDALRLAEERNLDLVEVSPNADPPVTKIMDYSKYRYQQKKAQQKNTSAKTSMKEIRMGVNIAEHDIVYKRNRMAEFLKAGHRVKVTVTFFGRQITHKEIGHDVMNKMLEGLDVYGKLENPPRMELNNLSVIVLKK